MILRKCSRAAQFDGLRALRRSQIFRVAGRAHDGQRSAGKRPRQDGSAYPGVRAGAVYPERIGVGTSAVRRKLVGVGHAGGRRHDSWHEIEGRPEVAPIGGQTGAGTGSRHDQALAGGRIEFFFAADHSDYLVEAKQVQREIQREVHGGVQRHPAAGDSSKAGQPKLLSSHERDRRQ